MRRTIQGARYDTDRALLLAERSVAGDRDWLREALYRTPRGRYFLCGQGGPASQWGRWLPSGEREEGGGIRPLTADAAQEWLRRWSDGGKST